jgi:hypothetical protein
MTALEILEQKIKKYLLPYNTFLKVTHNGDNTDTSSEGSITPPTPSTYWVEGEYTCGLDGTKTVLTLIQLRTVNGFPTGVTKANISSDPDYVSPYVNFGYCPVDFFNDEQSQDFTRNNCGTGYQGSTVPYTVLANTYVSHISKADANQKAAADIAANGQAYANDPAHGSCVGIDTTPNQFRFTDQYNIPLSSLTVSNGVTITGLTAQSPISVTGGEYQINNGAWVSVPGFINNNDVVHVRQTSSANPNISTNCVLTIGTISDTFTVTTVQSFTPNPFAFTDQDGLELNTLVESNTITISGITLSVGISISGGQYQKNGGAWTSATAHDVVNGDVIKVRTTTSSSYGTNANCTLMVGGFSDTFTAKTKMIYYNELQSQDFTKNDCGAGYDGSVVTYSVAASAYASFISLADANQKALDDIAANGQTWANNPIHGGVCIPNDPIPDPFTFIDQTGADISTQYESNIVTISGLTLPAPVSISAGQYRINGGSWVSATGSINNGDTIQVRNTSSGSYDTGVDTTLTIGGISDTYTITTIAVAVVNYVVNEQASPYADVNLQIKDNGSIIVDEVTTSSGSVGDVKAGHTITFEASTVAVTTGANPVLHLVVLRNGVSVYDQTTPAVPGASLLYTDTVVANAIYAATATSSADELDLSVTSDWFEDPTQSFCEQGIEEQANITNFASPTLGAKSSDNKLLYGDPTLDGVIWFDPLTITDGATATLIPIPATSGSNSRPTGVYYHEPSNRLYVNSFNGGGLTIIDCATKAIVNMLSFGTNGSFSRGNVYYIGALNEIWAVGNTGFLRINATTEAVITGSFTASGSVYITSVNNKIYVFYDNAGNKVDVFDNSLSLITSISSLCQNVSNNGQYVARGYYTDVANNKIYVGENSTTGGINVINAVTDTISNRIALDKEGDTYVGVGVIAFHPLRNTVYVGGAIFNDPAVDSQAKLWALDVASETITSTTSPSVNASITSIIYFSPNNSVYVGSAGLVPESVPNTGQGTDGIIFKFN